MDLLKCQITPGDDGVEFKVFQFSTVNADQPGASAGTQFPLTSGRDRFFEKSEDNYGPMDHRIFFMTAEHLFRKSASEIKSLPRCERIMVDEGHFLRRCHLNKKGFNARNIPATTSSTFTGTPAFNFMEDWLGVLYFHVQAH